MEGQALAPSGAMGLDALIRRLEKSDLVCAVVPKGSAGSNVLFEIGVAVGLNCPVFLILAEPHQIPAALRSFPYLRAPALDDVDALSDALTPITESLEGLRPRSIARRQHTGSGLPPRVSKSEGVSGSQRSSNFLERHRDLLKALESGFVSAGASVTSEPMLEHHGRSLRPDLLVWDPNLPADFGNPLVLELKVQSTPRADRDAVTQLSTYLAASKLRTGILVLDHEPDREIEITPVGYIFKLSASKILHAVAGRRLPDLLREIRNRMAHAPS